jgi:hypothetical protein
MPESEVETKPELGDDTQSEADSTMPETEEETAPKDEACDEANGEQKQQQQHEDGKFGMLIIAGEIQEHDSESHNRRPFE